MSHSSIAPEYELFPNRYRWTVAECNRMAEEGRLVGRYELLDGEVVSQTGQKPPHYLCISLLTQWAYIHFGGQFVRVQGPITLLGPDAIYSEPEPDIAVTCEPATAYLANHPGPDDLQFVVEVSDSTLTTDLIVKARLYARAGVAEYWRLDLNARQLYVHLNPSDGEYTHRSVHGEAETVTPSVRPGALLTISDVLPPVTA